MKRLGLADATPHAIRRLSTGSRRRRFRAVAAERMIHVSPPFD
jgi:hypothetical protein